TALRARHRVLRGNHPRAQGLSPGLLGSPQLGGRQPGAAAETELEVLGVFATTSGAANQERGLSSRSPTAERVWRNPGWTTSPNPRDFAAVASLEDEVRRFFAGCPWPL